MADQPGFEARIARIEALTATLDRCPDPEARAASRELVSVLLDLHGEGLARIIELASESGTTGQAIVASFCRDGLVANLLLLHDLHPDDLESRVRSTLESLRPRLGSNNEVDIVGLDGDRLRLRMSGGCGGCPSSAVAVKKTIEDAIFAAAPDLSTIEFVEEGVASSGLFSLPVITL